MKCIFILLIYLNFSIVQSQNDLTIVFEKKINPQLNTENLDKDNLSYLSFLNKNLNKFKYNLKIDLDKQISVFSSNYEMSIDGQERTDRLILNTLDGRFPIYTNIKKDSVYELSTPLNDISFFTRFYINSYNWQLIDSTRIIKGFRCKLAIGRRSDENPFIEFKNEIEYFAWYCPELPSKYGPGLFTGLPGLIVLAGYDYMIYEIKEIKKDNVTVNFPNRKSITESELIVELKKAMMNNKK